MTLINEGPKWIIFHPFIVEDVSSQCGATTAAATSSTPWQSAQDAQRWLEQWHDDAAATSAASQQAGIEEEDSAAATRQPERSDEGD